MPEAVAPSVDDPAASALPVLVACRPDVAARVRNHVEAVLGWQCVNVESAGWIAPRLLLVDGEVPAPDVAAPVVLLLEADVPGDVAARRAVEVGAVEVVSWPSGRDRLAGVAADVIGGVGEPGVPSGGRGRHGSDEVEPCHLLVAGAAGGVGATTVAMALGALASWRGREVLAVVRGDVPAPGVPTVAGEALGAPGVWGSAAAAPAAPRMRIVKADGHGPLPVPSLPSGALLVEEVGVQPELAHVLVARRDRAGQEAIAATPAAGIVLLDEGPLEEHRVLAGATSGTVVVLPRSARVARAGADLAVPGSLPGSWLEPLRSLLPGASPQPREVGRRRWSRRS